MSKLEFPASKRKIITIGQADQVTFYLINTKKIREQHSEWDTIVGCHHWGNTPYIPEGQIWIADRLTNEEILSVMIHEYIERPILRDIQITLNQSYESAYKIGHFIAKEQEQHISFKPHIVEQIMKRLMELESLKPQAEE